MQHTDFWKVERYSMAAFFRSASPPRMVAMAASTVSVDMASVAP